MSSGFVSSKEIEEERKIRQDEWEKVRKPDDSLVAPEPEICNQTLFEQLRNNREAKQAELEEAKKFKNMIRGIDEDESEFLAQIDNQKSEADKLKKLEEQEMLKEMAKTRSAANAVAAKISLKPSTSGTSGTVQKSKQASILTSAIKRKSTDSESSDSSDDDTSLPVLRTTQKVKKQDDCSE
ncbi:unnamed protein product [Caenorhabditis bovis]|uniref:FAM192A/Fyv6 N-terminal domain-containing protein n=1 Tax=Caenorhabditis bovis TaxID=2654633 RepID=A0A8S1F8D9_9PELO|nr:unnamed protein product [Caenorhabditis bovis]